MVNHATWHAPLPSSVLICGAGVSPASECRRDACTTIHKLGHYPLPHVALGALTSNWATALRL